MKFLHAADIHLDSPMAGLQARQGLPADLLRHCTRRAFAAMVDLAIAEDVAFVVIAGDLYDGDWKDFNTGLFVAEQMRRLGRPCFVLRGNHDAHSVITKDLRLPSNVREFSVHGCQTHRLDDLGVALHGHSFPKRAVPEDLSERYTAPVPAFLNIGVLHTSANDTSGEHETYAPCNPARLALKDYDYWALGHIHQRRVLHERPWIVFPGNLQGRHAKETGPKGCTLVTVQDRSIVAVEHRTVDVLRWAALEVDTTGLDVLELDRRLEAAVQAALAEADGRPLLARLQLGGQTALHARLGADQDRLVAHCRAVAADLGGELWIEKVQLRTRAPRVEATDELEPLHAAFLASLEDPLRVDALLGDMRELRKRLPAGAQDGLDLPSDAAGLERLAEEAWQLAAAAIQAEDRL